MLLSVSTQLRAEKAQEIANPHSRKGSSPEGRNVNSRVASAHGKRPIPSATLKGSANYRVQDRPFQGPENSV